jgi:hypothetical protein
MANTFPPGALVTDEEYARQVARQLLDLGAACQKAESFFAAESGALRSVYDVSAEWLLASLRKRFRSETA